MEDRLYTEEEYLALDAASEEKLEYWNGRIVPVHQDVLGMAGANPDHEQIVANLTAALHGPSRKRGCRIAPGHQRVQLPSGKFYYPDLVVACEPKYTESRPASLLNPLLMVEVTSDSTIAVDRGEKLSACTQIESLQEYWIVEQNRASLTRVVRDASGWRLLFAHGREAEIESETLGVSLPLAEVYALVEGLPEEPA